MALEPVTHISDLNASNPEVGDPVSEGDDHLRNIKSALLTDLPNINGPVTASPAELNRCDLTTLGQLNNDEVATVDGSGVMDCNTKSMTNVNIDSGTIDGDVTGETQTVGTTGTNLATLDYVLAAATGLTAEVKAVSSDITINDQDTYEEVPDIDWSNLATGLYKFEGFLYFSTNSTADFKYNLYSDNVTGNYIYEWMGSLQTAWEAVNDRNIQDHTTANNVPILVTNLVNYVNIKGNISVDNATNRFKLQFTQNTKTATDTKLLTGSWLSVWKAT